MAYRFKLQTPRMCFVAALSVSASTLCAGSAAAQAAAPADQTSDTAEDTNDADDMIIVTARRREENLQNVPVSVTAFGADQLQQRQISNDSDLQGAVPGLTIRQNGNANTFNYSLRGQSVDTYSNSPPGVLAYVNEFQLVTHSASTLYDMQGIQVLKGPQGTLFGRNTTGGAILFQTAGPSDVFEGYALGRLGNFDSHYVEGALSIPLADTIGLRIAGMYNGGGAFVRNELSGRRMGKKDIRSVRATLSMDITDTLTSTTVFQHTDEGGTNVPSLLYSTYGCGTPGLTSASDCAYGPLNPGFVAYIAAHPNIFPGGLAAYNGLQNERGPWRVAVNTSARHWAKSSYVINTSTLELSPTLSLKNIFGFNRSRSRDEFDYDGSPYPIFQTGGTPTADLTSIVGSQPYALDTRQVSNELQLQGNGFGDKLDFVLGLFLLEQTDEFEVPLAAFDFSPLAPASSFAYHQKNRDRSRAVFSQATYKLTDRLNATAGLRYTWDTITARQLPGSVFGTAFPVEKMRGSRPSWTASLDYRVAPTLLVYVAQRGSWRTGGYNFSVPPIDTTAAGGGNAFLKETTKDVELGFKYSGRDAGIPVTFNAAFYNQWVDNVQRAAYVTGPGGSASIVTVNVPKAEITGVEVDLSIRPSPWFSFGGAAAYTNARFTSPEVDLNGAITRYGPYADAPKWTGGFFVQLERDLEGDKGSLQLRADVTAQSKFYFSNVASSLSPQTTIGSYALVNGRLAWNDLLGSDVSAAIFVRNLLDRKYFAGGNSTGPTLGLNTAVPGQPRILGGELKLSF